MTTPPPPSASTSSAGSGHKRGGAGRRGPPPHATATARPSNTTTTTPTSDAGTDEHPTTTSSTNISSGRRPGRRGHREPMPSRWRRTSDLSLQDDSAQSGFSPNTLSDRYSAEIDHTTRQTEQTEAAAASVPPPTSLTSNSSIFWSMGGTDPQTERDMAAARSKAALSTGTSTASTTSNTGRKSKRLSTDSEASDLDVGDSYGRPAHLRRKNHPKGGVFGQKERFEHVDQSVNLMAMRGDDDADDTKKDTQSESTTKRRQRTRRGRFANKGRRSVLRTISLEFTEIALGRSSFPGFSSNNSSGSNLDDSGTIKEEGEDDDEEYEEISMMACCQCCCFTVFLVIIVLFMAGVIPLPEQWTKDAPTFEMPSIPGFTAEKSGEDLSSWDPVSSSDHGNAMAPPSPKRLYSPAPSPVHTHNNDRWDEIESIVIRAHLSRAEDLVDPDSIQHKALAWLSDIDIDIDSVSLQEEFNEAVVDYSDGGILERYALAVFFYATHEQTSAVTDVERLAIRDKYEVDDLDIMHDESLKAAFENSPEKKLIKSSIAQDEDSNDSEVHQPGDWHHRTGWMTHTHVCEWYGVQCHRSGRVIAIHLSKNHLSGSIPRELWALSELQHLDLSHNELQKQMPAVLWKPTGWPDLTTLDLSHNRLTGQLPDDIGGFEQLENITLAGNLFTGELPKSIAKLTSLKVLDLQGNNFTGPIRNTSPIPNLRILRLGENQFEGEFPFSLTRNRNLIELSLDQNQLQGTLPPELDSLHQLQLLRLGSNQLEGPIPDVFGRLQSLQVLELQDNLFGKHHDEKDTPAKMPTSLGLLANMKTMKINSNQIHGEIPEEWWNMTRLEVFHLYDNDFVGSIPTAIGDFSALQDFQVQDSFMSGNLPTQLGKCQMLETLRIYNGRFTGTVPNQICELHKESEEAADSGKKLALLAADCKSAVECACCDRCY